MSKLIAVLGGALLLGAGIATVQLVGSSDPASATSTTTSGTITGTTTGTTIEGVTTGTTTTAGDISGPCDEAEHRNDPRCTGAADDDRGGDDRSGRGRGGDDDRGEHDDSGRGRGGDDHDDDRSGSNSGRG